jgi:putative SOS response-associated peptidase YedK
MCFFFNQSKTAQELEHRFNAKFEKNRPFYPDSYSGFMFPKTPVITNTEKAKIQLFQWGLIPFWAKDDRIKKYTLNARIETLTEKPAFKNSVNHRCLILTDSFFEWQWLDEKGKQKQKFLITLPNNEPFAFAGLWSEWTNKQSGEIINTYTILTTEANELMSKIHNTKKRMPVILSQHNETDWLNGLEMKMQNERLTATALHDR